MFLVKGIYDLFNEVGDDVIFEIVGVYSNMFVDDMFGFGLLFFY